MKEEYIYLKSENYLNGFGAPFRTMEVRIDFAEEDWKGFEEDASRLNFGSPVDLLSARLKRAVRAQANISRIESPVDRKRLQDDNFFYWIRFVRYLMYAHPGVLAFGGIIEILIGSGRHYVVFYWILLISLTLAFLAWAGLKLSWLLHSRELGYETDALMRIELYLARSAEYFMVASLLIFSVTILARAVLGVVFGLQYFEPI